MGHGLLVHFQHKDGAVVCQACFLGLSAMATMRSAEQIA